MTNSEPFRMYDHPDVDPMWDRMAPGGQPAIAHLLGTIELPLVHRQLLRSALPGLKIIADMAGKGPARLETVRLRHRLMFWNKIGLIEKSGDDLVRILNPAALRDFALKHDLWMPLDGLQRAHAWASKGTTFLHYQEATALKVLMDEYPWAHEQVPQ